MAKKRATKYDREISRASRRFQGNGKKPGERAREQQLAAEMKDRSEYMSMSEGSAITGNVSTKSRVSKAKAALKRQRRLRETGGKSAY